MRMRKKGTFMALQLQQLRLDSQAVPSEAKFQAALTSQFDKTVTSTFDNMRMKEGVQKMEEVNEAESRLRKFTAICEED
jgi:hypothetical protein